MKRFAVLIAAAAVLLVSLAFLAGILQHPRYTPDGIVYARFAARDAGMSDRDAVLTARHYYERPELLGNPRYRELIEVPVDRAFAISAVFENRVLYPRVSSWLLPFAGMRALWIVSAVCYVAFGIALFALVATFAPAWISAALAALVLALPSVRGLAQSDLTDMMGLLWWTLALLCVARFVRSGAPLWGASIVAATALLTLTRPVPFVVALCAAVAAVVVWNVRSMRTRALVAAVLGASGLLVYAAIVFAHHGYLVGNQLQWVYDHDPRAHTLPFGAWYRGELALTVRTEIVTAIRAIYPIPLLAAMGFAILRRPSLRLPVGLALGGIVASLALIPFEPHSFDLPRVVNAPMLPCFALALGAMLQEIPLEVGSRRAREVAA